MPLTRPPKHTRRVSKSAIRRAVASSTAIETGQSVAILEKKLRASSPQFRHLKLAEDKSA